MSATTSGPNPRTTRARHLPPMVRVRPPGVLDRAHAGVEAKKTGAGAAAWRLANDPDRTVQERTRYLRFDGSRR